MCRRPTTAPRPYPLFPSPDVVRGSGACGERTSHGAELFVVPRLGSRSGKPPCTRPGRAHETAADPELVGAGYVGLNRFGQGVIPPFGGIVPGQAPDCWAKARQLAGATIRNWRAV